MVLNAMTHAHRTLQELREATICKILPQYICLPKNWSTYLVDHIVNQSCQNFFKTDGWFILFLGSDCIAVSLI